MVGGKEEELQHHWWQEWKNGELMGFTSLFPNFHIFEKLLQEFVIHLATTTYRSTEVAGFLFLNVLFLINT